METNPTARPTPAPTRASGLLDDLLGPDDAPDAAPHADLGLYPRPPAARRGAALVLDLAVALAPSLLLAAVFNLGDALFFGQGVGYLLGAAYVLLRDGHYATWSSGRSLGKRVMALRPLRLADGEATTRRESVRRGAPLALIFVLLALDALANAVALYWLGNVFFGLALTAGLAAYVVEGALALKNAGGRRFGDRLAGTQVVESEA